LEPLLPAIRIESGMKPDFLEEIFEVPGGDKIKECIQCGTCSGSCPASPFMDHTPRQIIAMIRAGMRDDVLSSNTIWMCASCYLCQVRCPAQIKITDIMYGLKRLAVREGKGRPSSSEMARVFVDNINRFGRNDERLLILRYYLKTDPTRFFGYAPLGMAMITHGIMSFGLPERIRGLDQLQAIIRKVEEEGVV